MNHVRKVSILMILLLTAVLGAGCMNKDKETAESAAKRKATIVIDEQKQIVITYTETFDKSYYNSEELESKVTEELSEFNKENSKDNGAVMKSLKVSDEKAVLKILFTDPETYVSYGKQYVKPDKDIELFIGTYKEAVSAGYTFEGKFTEAEDLTDVKKEDFDETENLMVIYTNESHKILVPGEIVYFGSSVSLEQGLAVTSDEKENYIIYKPKK